VAPEERAFAADHTPGESAAADFVAALGVDSRIADHGCVL